MHYFSNFWMSAIGMCPAFMLAGFWQDQGDPANS